jgi:hypothetical protein
MWLEVILRLRLLLLNLWLCYGYVLLYGVSIFTGLWRYIMFKYTLVLWMHVWWIWLYLVCLAWVCRYCWLDIVVHLDCLQTWWKLYKIRSMFFLNLNHQRDSSTKWFWVIASQSIQPVLKYILKKYSFFILIAIITRLV